MFPPPLPALIEPGGAAVHTYGSNPSDDLGYTIIQGLYLIFPNGI